jgi:hypothetical protein
MKCFNDFLNTPNGQSCPELVGMRPHAVIYPRSAVASWEVDDDNDVTITFKPGFSGIDVYMPEQLPYKPTVEGTKNDFGLTKFTKKVTFFFVENTSLSHEQIISLQNDGYVLFAEDNMGRSLVFGLEAGLRFLTSSQDFNSTDTHGGIVVEMQEANCNYSMLFISISPVTYEYISGLTIGTGVSVAKQVTLFVETLSPVSYIIMPDATVLTTDVNGTLNTTYSGVAGSVLLIIPKTNNAISLSDGGADASELIGVLSTNYATVIEIENCSGITGINAPLSTDIGASDCALNANAIALIMALARATGEEDGNIDVSGGTNADLNDWTAQAELDRYYLVNTMGWAILYNEA